jgi:hypothetical protein
MEGIGGSSEMTIPPELRLDKKQDGSYCISIFQQDNGVDTYLSVPLTIDEVPKLVASVSEGLKSLSRPTCLVGSIVVFPINNTKMFD